MTNEKINNRGDRIRIERLMLGERLGRKLSQEAFAEIIGKQKGAMFNYERNKRVMGQEDLEAIHAAGGDVFFLITGERTTHAPLPESEQKLLRLFHTIDPSQQATLLTLVENFARSFPVQPDTDDE
ncbi:MAG: XRE family transcriptional regulator [Moraxellaceae bacterium]|nr:MAG: XRE family transcriptional regulator [Moraxellaceae bacterium]